MKKGEDDGGRGSVDLALLSSPFRQFLGVCVFAVLNLLVWVGVSLSRQLLSEAFTRAMMVVAEAVGFWC